MPQVQTYAARCAQITEQWLLQMSQLDEPAGGVPAAFVAAAESAAGQPNRQQATEGIVVLGALSGAGTAALRVDCSSPATFSAASSKRQHSTAGASSAGFESGQGFGSPLAHALNPNRNVTWKELVIACRLQPGDHLTVCIMDFCDWGCLADAIKINIFKVSVLLSNST